MKKYISNYFKDIQNIIDTLDKEDMEKILSMFCKARQEEKRIFVLGNGGSSAHANHFACDLGKNVTKDEIGRFKIISVCENIATITAYANDINYDSVFSEQLKNYRIEEGDVILAISASGNSPNVLRAVEYGKLKGALIISLVGFNGGKLKEMSNLYLHVRSNEYEKVEDLHLVVMHIIVSYFKNGGVL